ncbi:hypothetical protein YTPLAS18_18730 [Nitrospira sp.]|nr:hypothetical protein YTPLAS18_18730 [Nitrospira sp.]
MNTPTWIVKTGVGEDWGLIRRLIIGSKTKQIHYVDIVIVNTGKVVRLPWETFEIHNEEIRLGIPETQAHARGARASKLGDDAFSMDVWP